MPDVQPDSAETAALLEQVRLGHPQARERLLARHRDDIHRFVSLRFDPRLASRFDPSDVVQESLAEVDRRMDDFLSRKPMPFRLWLRKTAYERLLTLRRNQLRQRRSVLREQAWPDRSSLLLARPLLKGEPSPSQEAVAREVAEAVSLAVAGLSESDREVLLMRHVEELPYEEIACLLDIDAAAARKRYGRALIRLQRALSEQSLLD
jgi:RNA polymerase sigma-70 factor (ECF subfamily)